MGPPAVSSRARRLSALQRLLEGLPVRRERVERGERRLRRRGSEDARLVGAVEGLTLGELGLGDAPFLRRRGSVGTACGLFGLCALARTIAPAPPTLPAPSSTAERVRNARRSSWLMVSIRTSRFGIWGI